MPNIISKHQVHTQLCSFMSGGTRVRAGTLKDTNPFTQWVVQHATYVWLQE